jgi:hypothetical protein
MPRHCELGSPRPSSEEADSRDGLCCKLRVGADRHSQDSEDQRRDHTPHELLAYQTCLVWRFNTTLTV